MKWHERVMFFVSPTLAAVALVVSIVALARCSVLIPTRSMTSLERLAVYTLARWNEERALEAH